MKIAVLDKASSLASDQAWQAFESLGEVAYYDATSPEELSGHMAGADAVITVATPIPKTAMAACPSLRYIGVVGDDCSFVDYEGAQSLRIGIKNFPEARSELFAQAALGALCDICPEGFLGKTLGLIGNDKSARLVADAVTALGGKVIVYEGAFNMGYHRNHTEYVFDLPTFLSRVDALSIHPPLLFMPQGMEIMRGFTGSTPWSGS